MLKFEWISGVSSEFDVMLEVGGAGTFEGVYSDEGKVSRRDSYNVT
jgi:hypothetical protein